jgi:hypothetical protein
LLEVQRPELLQSDILIDTISLEVIYFGEIGAGRRSVASSVGLRYSTIPLNEIELA